MRVAGFVLIACGLLMIATSVLGLAAGGGEAECGELSESQLRMDAFFPGAMTAFAGFVLILMSKPKADAATVAAIAAEDWISVPLSDAAAEFALRAIVERKFPPGTGLRIEEDEATQAMVIKFDSSPDPGRDFVSEDKGVAVFVDKSLALHLKNKTIDLERETLVVADTASD